MIQAARLDFGKLGGWDDLALETFHNFAGLDRDGREATVAFDARWPHLDRHHASAFRRRCSSTIGPTESTSPAPTVKKTSPGRRSAATASAAPSKVSQ